MRCSNCKHVAELREALKPCAACDSRDCERCKVLADFRKIDRFCTACDAGSLHGEIHYDGVSGGLVGLLTKVRMAEDANGATESGGATALDPDTEDKLRIVLSSLMQLDPLLLLLVRHVFQHRPMAAFRQTLREIRDRLANRYDLRDVDDNGDKVTSFKSVVSLWGKQVVEKVPALADVFAANKTEAAGAK